MKKVYENLLERLDKTRMESEGVYITFYESLEEYIKEQQELGYTRREIIEQMSKHVDVEKLDGSFIMLEAQSSDGMYVWHDVDTEDIIDFLKSETAYKKYIKKEIDEFNIDEIIERVENFELELSECPEFAEIREEEYIIHFIDDIETPFEVFYKKIEGVDQEHANDLADLYDYDKVVAYRIDGKELVWLD